MNDDQDLGLRKINRAIISVSDKTGVVEFARTLVTLGVEIISTGGTAKTLREAGIEVRDVSDVTGFPEMLDGRVKTLHPKVHGGLLGIRDNSEHTATMREHNIEPIDMVVINLYPFEETLKRPDVTTDEAIEQIDIGGPAMIRSASKNWESVLVVTSPNDYLFIEGELKEHNGQISRITRRRQAHSAFMLTGRYDLVIAMYFAKLDAWPPPAIKTPFSKDASHGPGGGGGGGFGIVAGTGGASAAQKAVDVTANNYSIDQFQGSLPDSASWTISKHSSLRYGENPHQIAALYRASARGGVTNADVLSGKEMSYNNYLDADAAWNLVRDFNDLACAIIKHTNPAGVGLAAKGEEAYRKALATDPVSAFGGIVAFNRVVDIAAAKALTEIFTEVVIAPGYDDDALAVLKSKKSLRVLHVEDMETTNRLEYRQVGGGLLVQARDAHQLRPEDLKVVSQRAPTDEETRALLFAWTVCKHTKSNAIVYAREDQTVGVGAGQMSRVDSVKLGAMRAQLPVKGSVLASDAFFPFRDGLDEAAKHGITAVIQPGGSMRDAEVIAAADEYNLAMVFTGIRHFKH